jgi:aminodeoxyfutalosine deaminase
VASLDEHPLATLVGAGVPVSINSDDPPMFGTTLVQEYAVAAQLLGLDAHGVGGLARAAVEQSFGSPAAKATLLAEIDAYVAAKA